MAFGRRKSADADENSATEKPPTRTLALNRLSAREYSASELWGYLKKKGCDEDEIAEVIGELLKDGTLNDQRYSRVIARHQANRGKGPRYIMMKLKSKGVRTDLPKTKAIFDETSPLSERELAQQIIDTRYPRAHEDDKEKSRAYNGLLRRGFSSEVIAQCLFKGRGGPIRD